MILETPFSLMLRIEVKGLVNQFRRLLEEKSEEIYTYNGAHLSQFTHTFLLGGVSTEEILYSSLILESCRQQGGHHL